MHSSGEIIQRLWRESEHQAGLRLVAVWQTWSEIIGPDLAELVKPLGHQDGTLFVGVEDSVVMQETSFQASFILHAVNAFLGEPFFDKVHYNLIGGRTSLDAAAKTFSGSPGRGRPELSGRQRPPDLGALHNGFFTIPALERCYRAFLRHFNVAQRDNSPEMQ